MTLNLFAGLPVADHPAALVWYEQLFGTPPTFVVHDTEVVWELAGHRSVYVVRDPGRAGHALVTVFLDEGLGELLAGIRGRGIEPTTDETYPNGVRKVTFHDPEGNEVGFGGPPGQPPE